MRQTEALIAEGLNEQEKWFRKKARPKVLLAETFEEAQALYVAYRRHQLGIVTDVEFPRGGGLDGQAGFGFIREIVREDIPVVVQSSQPEHRRVAEALGIPFHQRHPEVQLQGIRDFLKDHLGFGDFVFRMPDGRHVERVRDIREFVEVIQRMPLESIRHHGMKNDFSRWLMARGEISLARELKPKKVSDFRDAAEVREYLVSAIMQSRQEKQAGMITDFCPESFEFEETFNRLGGGSLGGKGRGLAFLSLLLHQSGIRSRFEDCRVRLPDTMVVGTDVFDAFMAEHHLHERLAQDLSDADTAGCFLSARLPDDIRDALSVFIAHVRQPLAVRSSSLLEDSQNQPFAGVYETYMLPNNNTDQDLRLEQLCKAIKLVYASTFSSRAKAYIQVAAPGVEEKMAVIIQKLVGRAYDGRYYPISSGVGQSSNFYPSPPLRREDGIVCVALGLGRMVVEGGRVLSFSPAHPEILPGMSSPEDHDLRRSARVRYASACIDRQGAPCSGGEGNGPPG
jgi:hypothetical protein